MEILLIMDNTESIKSHSKSKDKLNEMSETVKFSKARLNKMFNNVVELNNEFFEFHQKEPKPIQPSNNMVVPFNVKQVFFFKHKIDLSRKKGMMLGAAIGATGVSLITSLVLALIKLIN